MLPTGIVTLTLRPCNRRFHPVRYPRPQPAAAGLAAPPGLDELLTSGGSWRRCCKRLHLAAHGNACIAVIQSGLYST
jgi:hypothetical protein